MKVTYSPTVSDTYQNTVEFSEDKIEITIIKENEELEKRVYDLSNIEKGKNYESDEYILDVKRTDDLEVRIAKFIGLDAEKCDAYPETFYPELKDIASDDNIFKLEEVDDLTDELSPIEKLEKELDKQKQRADFLESCLMELTGELLITEGGE